MYALSVFIQSLLDLQHVVNLVDSRLIHTLLYDSINLVRSGFGSGRAVAGCGHHKKVKIAYTRLLSIEFRSWSRFLAVSLQVTWVINQAVCIGCQNFLPGLQLPPQPLRGLPPISLLAEQRHDEYSLLKTVTRQRHGCNLNPGPSAHVHTHRRTDNPKT